MSDLVLNTETIDEAARQLRTKGEEMKETIQVAEGAISPLREMVSKRISRDLESWDEIKSTFMNALNNLVNASDELARAANDFRSADLR